MKKYALKTKIGQKITLIEINIRSENSKNNTSSFNKDGIFVKKYKIVYQNRYKIAINDDWITTLNREKIGDKKDGYNYLNECHVKIKTQQTYWPNGIFGEVYTLGEIDEAIQKLTQAMQDKIDEQYGFLQNINIESIVNSYKLNL